MVFDKERVQESVRTVISRSEETVILTTQSEGLTMMQRLGTN